MFSAISTAFKIVSNLDTIKSVAQSVFTVVVKLVNVITFIQGQVTDTKLGKLLNDYLPVVLSALTKVVEVFNKYGPIIGINTDVVEALTEADAKKELEKAIADLENHFK